MHLPRRSLPRPMPVFSDQPLNAQKAETQHYKRFVSTVMTRVKRLSLRHHSHVDAVPSLRAATEVVGEFHSGGSERFKYLSLYLYPPHLIRSTAIIKHPIGQGAYGKILRSQFRRTTDAVSSSKYKSKTLHCRFAALSIGHQDKHCFHTINFHKRVHCQVFYSNA